MDTRAYPFQYVDLRQVPVSSPTGVSAGGAPPEIPWADPSGRTQTVHSGDAVIEVPRGLVISAVLGQDLIATGGCTKPTGCGDKPRGDVHLLASDGSLTTLDPEPGSHQVFGVVSSPEGSEAAWVSSTPSGNTLWHYAAGDPAPTELPFPASINAGTSPRVVGFLGPGDVVLSLKGGGGRTVVYARTSGEQAGWGADSLVVAAPGVLLGPPTFTPRRENCLARFGSDSTRPDWTRCYRWGKREADGFYSYPMSPDGRYLVTMVLDELFILDGRTGEPVRRVRFDDRLQHVAFEDSRHVLVVLSRGDDLSWIVRCTLDLRCEQATDQIGAIYETVRFVPE